MWTQDPARIADDELARTEDGLWRVRVVEDDSAEEPYDDGASPVVVIERRSFYRPTARQVNPGGWRVPPELLDTIARAFAQDSSGTLCGRYLRAFWGTTSVEPVDTVGGDWYALTFDTSEWRELVGASEGSADGSEWSAYLRGECFGVVVERLEEWTASDGRTARSWECVDSLWGFYGQSDYLEQTARELLGDLSTHYAERVARSGGRA